MMQAQYAIPTGSQYGGWGFYCGEHVRQQARVNLAEPVGSDTNATCQTCLNEAQGRCAHEWSFVMDREGQHQSDGKFGRSHSSGLGALHCRECGKEGKPKRERIERNNTRLSLLRYCVRGNQEIIKLLVDNHERGGQSMLVEREIFGSHADAALGLKADLAQWKTNPDGSSESTAPVMAWLKRGAELAREYYVEYRDDDLRLMHHEIGSGILLLAESRRTMRGTPLPLYDPRVIAQQGGLHNMRAMQDQLLACMRGEVNQLNLMVRGYFVRG